MSFGPCYFQLPLQSWRLLSSNDIPNAATNGGLLAKDTAPRLERKNAGTDPALRIAWPAGSQVPVTIAVVSPDHIDTTASMAIQFYGAMSGTTDQPTLGVTFFNNVGGTNTGGNTDPFTNTPGTHSVVLSSVTGSPAEYTVTVTPGAHPTDELYLYGAYGRFFITG